MSGRRLVCHLYLTLLCSTAGAAGLYQDGESQVQQAQRLTHELTPLGAERAGNGTDIPPWRGGLSMPPLSYSGPGHARPDPFEHDAPLTRITPANVQHFQNMLPSGFQSLLAGADFTLFVYPSRRTAAAPNNWYEQTYLNVLQQPDRLEQMAGGVPYPMPSRGSEVLSNATLRWQGRHYYGFERLFQVRQGGIESWPLASWSVFPWASPRQLSWPERVAEWEQQRRESLAASGDVFGGVPGGVSVALWHSWRERELDGAFHQQQVIYLTSTELSLKRLAEGNRPAPNILSPTLLSGQPEQYHWQLLGKRELLIPYNNYRLSNPESGAPAFLTAGLPDFSRVRFEKHRVWVIDGVLKGREKAVYGKQVLYIDEDSWAVVMADRYSTAGKLTSVAMALLTTAYEVPAIVAEYQLEFNRSEGEYWFHALDDRISRSRDYSRMPVPVNSISSSPSQ